MPIINLLFDDKLKNDHFSFVLVSSRGIQTILGLLLIIVILIILFLHTTRSISMKTIDK